MSTLDAVNEMPELIGEPPVDALDTGGVSIEAEAEAILDRERRRILGRGPGPLGAWHATYFPSREYDLDAGVPDLSEDSVIAVRWSGWPYKEVTLRGGTLYDLDEDEPITTGTVKLDVVENRPLADLTPRLRDLVVASAGMIFQRAKKRGREDDTYARDRMTEARVAALQEDGDLDQSNVFRTRGSIDVMGRRWSYRGFVQ